MTEQNVLATPPRQIHFDDGRHARAKICYVLLATEQTVQDDVMRLRPPGVGVHFTRAGIADSIINVRFSAPVIRRPIWHAPTVVISSVFFPADLPM